MSTFHFHPELFAERTRAMEALGDRDLHWFSSYRSVDIEHDFYGLEVCGIRDQETAELVGSVLRGTFPEWKYGGMRERTWWEGDPGWQVVICREPLHVSDADGGEAPEEGLLPADRARLGLDTDAEADPEDEDVGASVVTVEDPIRESLRREAVGDALRRAGDDRGAVMAYLEATLLIDGAPIPASHPGHQFRLLLLNLKSAEAIENLGEIDLAEEHRRLAHLTLSGLAEDPPARSLPRPCAGKLPAGGGAPSLTGLRLGVPGSFDPAHFAPILDSETGLLNRRGLESVLNRQAMAETNPSAYGTLVLLKIENSVAIAEHSGPDAFTVVIREVGRRLLAVCHGSGLLVRWGPATFAVFFVEETLQGAARAHHWGIRAERQLAHRPLFPLPGGPPVALRLARGVATSQGPGCWREDLPPEAEHVLRMGRSSGSSDA